MKKPAETPPGEPGRPTARSDKRTYPRVPINIEVTIDRLGEGHVEHEQTHSLDIGLGGIHIPLPEALPVGDLLTVCFALPGYQAPVRVRGRIAWQHAYTIGGESAYDTGVHFVDISDADRETLQTLIVGP